MVHEFSVTITEDLIRNHTRMLMFRYFSRHWAKSVIFALLVVLGIAISFITKSAFSYLIAVTSPLGFAAFLLMLYFGMVRLSLDRLMSLGSPEIQWQLSEHDLTLRSDLAAVSTRWEEIKSVECFRSFWVISGKTQRFMLPIADVPQEALDFILRKVPRHDCKIG